MQHRSVDKAERICLCCELVNIVTDIGKLAERFKKFLARFFLRLISPYERSDKSRLRNACLFFFFFQLAFFHLIQPNPFRSFAFAFWLLGKIVWKIKGQQALGEADIYIVAVMGAILGLSQGSLAILIGALLTIPAFAVANQKNYELPFVPFLALGLLITYMFGEKIVTFLKDVGILI